MPRVLAFLAMLDCAATASIWWYLVQFKITDKFLFAISGVWVFAICALVALLVYVSSELNGQLVPLSRLRKQ
ncbi:MAG: hypothetical protein ING66_02850 [Rhodocyclaceae bacterium]|nr:hypothetical protein [Rhodocyclaceae bacterium]MCA3025524.1 hypothetical protein [Rhodocyclaceae bacterium]MCA3027513.1 hypothetical protein [Rhodocyclaceae bacterium]MCA3033364.1 hypothetical protein [Rhodocyclaceae bacterium]MCA3038896.1 hypothetical protein [Rhodocyclaceae bacterium]